MKAGVAITVDHLAKVRRAVDGLAKRDVLVGIPDGRTDRNYETEKDVFKDDDTTNAAIGYLMEFGSPAQNIPARPFLMPGIRNRADQNQARLRKAAIAALDGDIRERNRQLEAMGQETRDSVKAMIRSNIQPALSPVTLAARRKRGKTSEHTLIDSGQLLNSINYLVRKKPDEPA